MSDPRPMVAVVEPLTVLEEQLLAFEHRRWRFQGAKEQAMKDELDLSATRYYQLLNDLIDKPAALVADPMLIKRLRRRRQTRRSSRSA